MTMTGNTHVHINDSQSKEDLPPWHYREVSSSIASHLIPPQSVDPIDADHNLWPYRG